MPVISRHRFIGPICLFLSVLGKDGNRDIINDFYKMTISFPFYDIAIFKIFGHLEACGPKNRPLDIFEKIYSDQILEILILTFNLIKFY